MYVLLFPAQILFSVVFVCLSGIRLDYPVDVTERAFRPFLLTAIIRVDAWGNNLKFTVLHATINTLHANTC